MTNAAHNTRAPSTSAAPGSGGGTDPRAAHELALEVAIEMESRRRTLTLGGSLLFIPASAGVVLAGAAVLGVPMVWLPVCLLIGLSIGPALTTASLAVGNLVGAPGTRALFHKRALALGVPAADVDEIWRDAIDVAEARARARLARGTRAAHKELPEAS